jgi:ASC-1-like (ASCH) protein
MIHQMRLSAEPFKKIKTGQKTIESRLYDKKRRQISIDDEIEFTCTKDPSKKILTKVKGIYKYASFEELFSSLPIKYFGGNSKEELLKEVQTFYSRGDQEKYGVIGIKIGLIKNMPS